MWRQQRTCPPSWGSTKREILPFSMRGKKKKSKGFYFYFTARKKNGVNFLQTCLEWLRWMNPSLRSRPESGYSAGRGEGGAAGTIL